LLILFFFIEMISFGMISLSCIFFEWHNPILNFQLYKI
jgi:hypothetical protein